MSKIIPYDKLDENIRHLKSAMPIVLAGGCFDILHDGHTAFLHAAKNLGNTLIILLESDESVKKRKGKNRPVYTHEIRAHNLSLDPAIDFIIMLPHLKTDKEYYELTKRIEPDIIAITKNDPSRDHKVKQAESVGGRVVEVIERLPDLSTTKIIETQLNT